MSATTIEIPADHVGPVHQSLLSRRDILGGSTRATPGGEIEELDGLIRQLEQGSAQDLPEGRRLTGSREALWTAIYDAACAAAERVSECCNEYWQNADLDRPRLEITLLTTGLDLLEELGPPPRG